MESMWTMAPILFLLFARYPGGPPQFVANQAVPFVGSTLPYPAGCDVVYDANMGQEEFTDAAASCIIRRPDGLVWDLLIVDDFEASRAGRITDAYLYLTIIHQGPRSPSDGVRICLWGSGETPTEEPTLVRDVPPSQIRFWSLGWFEGTGYEIQATGLSIPYFAGRNWISIQPHDLSPGAQTYFLLRNDQIPLRGHDSYVKDGPESQTPGYGFTDWRTAGSQGYDVADSFIRLETCDANDFTISLAGECGGQVEFSWENAPPDESLIGIYARTTGQFIIPQGFTCAGTTLGLGSQGIRKVFQINSGTGSGSLRGHLRAVACPGYFQAVIGGAGPCQVSNVISTP